MLRGRCFGFIEKGIPLSSSVDGVYIYRKSKNMLYKKENWNVNWNNEQKEVVLKSGSHMFAILDQTSGLRGGDGYVTGLTFFSYVDSAKNDFRGKSTTDLIVSHFGLYNLNHEAMYYCVVNGGYLPALGELILVFNHINEINKCKDKAGLSLINIVSGWEYISSTYKDKRIVWVMPFGGTASYKAYGNTFNVIPIKQI